MLTGTKPLSFLNSRRASTLAGLVGLVLLTWAVGSTTSNVMFDDAFITYRYARNIALGRGFHYNAGEQVLGTTTPLYTILLAGLGAIWPDIPSLSRALGILFWSGLVAVTFLLARRYAGWTGGLLAAVLVATNKWVALSIGMETTLYVLLLVSAFAAYLSDRYRLTSVLLALLVLTRPDGALAVAIVALHYVWRHRRLPWREAVIVLALLLPWIGYSLVTFGSPIPNSASAKIGQSGRMLIGENPSTFLDGLSIYVNNLMDDSVLYILALPMLLLGGWAARRTTVAWLAAAWLIGYTVAYTLLGVVYFNWYYAPLVPFAAVLVGSGLPALDRAVKQWGQRFGLWGKASRMLALAGLPLLLLNAHMVSLVDVRSNPGAHNRTYEQVAHWLAHNTPADASVALIEIGIVGYYSDRFVVDTMGLITAGMTRYQADWLQTLQYAVTQYWPDYVVALSGTAWDGIRREAWFRDRYEAATEILNPPDPASPVIIFRRKADMPSVDYAPIDVRFGEIARLTGLSMSDRSLAAGQVVYLGLRWRALGRTADNYRVTVVLFDPVRNIALTQSSAVPAHGGAPTSIWQPGDEILDEQRLQIPDPASPGRYEVWVSMKPVGGSAAVPLYSAHEERIGDVAVVGAVKVADPDRSVPAAQNLLSVVYDDQIELIGYDDLPALAAPGDSIAIDLYWKALREISADYTVFVHLLDGDGRLSAQADGQPQGGIYPTSIWDAGEIVLDRHTLTLPPDLALGEYTIKSGLYLLATGERLTARTADGAPLPDNGAVVSTLRVERP